ncbi:hypothetical protein MMC10_005246 [Thelotrema lepadinum]|nr:hypothetical protein [Thelotrema lepadinum]
MKLSIAWGLSLLLFRVVDTSSLLGIPTLPFEETTPSSSFSLLDVQEIIVDAGYAGDVDSEGETLIPPSLWEFASTFADDLQSASGSSVRVINGTEASQSSVFLTLAPSTTKFVDAAGRPTSEGYTLNVTDAGLLVEGASPLGVWWGTRSILQQLILGNGSIPLGSGYDSPGWGIRGAMLDVGRHFYPPDFLVEMCSFLSYFKQNTFHVHMSDNLYNNPDYTPERQEELYAAFRPNSPAAAVAGLNKRANESYYESDLDYIQESCAMRGVTFLPEIEAPGHALVITQWKPELALDSDASLLNITVPETIPTMESIWDTFLPWFHSKTVHIGADEYTGPEVDYTNFVNALSSYIASSSQKAIRIWGTFTPNKTEGAVNVNQNVSIQHWEFFEDNPYYDYIKNNYSVLNSDDAFYIVNKYSGSYPQSINISRIFNGNPLGGSYAPNIFDTNNATNNPSRSEPLVLGHIAAQWNDYGPNTSTYLEAYYSWRDGLPGLADKQWGGNLTESEYLPALALLQSFGIPGENLDRQIQSKSSTILQYNFSQPTQESSVPDLSGNNYTGSLNTSCAAPSNGTLQLSSSCSLTTPLTSKGRNYTLSLTINPTTSVPAPFITGRDSILYLGYEDSTNVTFETAGNLFPLNYTVSVGEWTTLKLTGRGNQTFLQAGDGDEMEFKAKIGVNGESFVWAEIEIEAPLQMFGGGWEGSVKDIELLNNA